MLNRSRLTPKKRKWTVLAGKKTELLRRFTDRAMSAVVVSLLLFILFSKEYTDIYETQLIPAFEQTRSSLLRLDFPRRPNAEARRRWPVMSK